MHVRRTCATYTSPRVNAALLIVLFSYIFNDIPGSFYTLTYGLLHRSRLERLQKLKRLGRRLAQPRSKRRPTWSRDETLHIANIITDRHYIWDTESCDFYDESLLLQRETDYYILLYSDYYILRMFKLILLKALSYVFVDWTEILRTFPRDMALQK